MTEPTVPRITKTQYEAVRKAHILRPAYDDARLFGATHGEILAAHVPHIDVRSYGYARTAGATHAELLEAQSAGAEISTYVDARRAGATHWDVLAVCREGVPLHDYMKVRRKEATHDDAIGAHRAMIPLRDYANARSAGATHEEIMTAHAAGVPPRTYSLLRKRGMTHREILAVHEIAISLRAKPDEIVDALNNATVAELVAAYRAGIDPVGYSRARARGENHKTAMGVAATIDRDGGADFDCYIAARETGDDARGSSAPKSPSRDSQLGVVAAGPDTSGRPIARPRAAVASSGRKYLRVRHGLGQQPAGSRRCCLQDHPVTE